MCGSMRSVEFCRTCRKPLCPSHRAGTGELSDGYFCVGEGSTCFGGYLFGIRTAVATTSPVKTFWERRYRAPRIVYYAVGFGLGVALVAGYTYWMGWG